MLKSAKKRSSTLTEEESPPENPIQSPSNKEKRKQKKHTKFKKNLHHGTIFLQKTIQCDESNPTRFICLLCKESFYSNRNFSGFFENLKGHLSNKQHEKTLDDAKLKASCQNAIRFLEKQEAENLSEGMEEEEKENEAQINSITSFKLRNEPLLKFELVAFLISNNLPFSLGEHLLELVQHLNEKFSPNTISKATINDHQISQIARNCIARTIQQKLFRQLEDSPYSISLDEASDKFGKGFLALSARYFSRKDANDPQTLFLGLIELEDSATGEILQ